MYCYLWYAGWISRDVIAEFPDPSVIRFSILRQHCKVQLANSHTFECNTPIMQNHTTMTRELEC